MEQRITTLDEALDFLLDFHAPSLGSEASIDYHFTEDSPIPLPLRKVYTAFGDRRNCEFDPTSGQDTLSPPDDLPRIDNYVHFVNESQACWSCAYLADAGDDPPVYLVADDGPEKRCNSLSEFLITFLLQEAIMVAPHMAHHEGEKSACAALKPEVEPLWLDAVYSQPNPSHSFHWAPEPRILIMRFHGDYAPWLWLASYEEHWETVLHKCEDGFIVGNDCNQRAACLNPEKFEVKRLPEWLRWLE